MAPGGPVHRFHEQIHGVWFDDLDPYGILHNARYIVLFERTLGSFWHHVGFGGLQESPERYHLVASNHVAYKAPVRGSCQVRVRVWVESLGTTSLTFGFRLMPLDVDVDAATGSRTIVHVDPVHFRPAPWSDDFRAVMTPWLDREAS